jgi:hypothetical protein
MENAKMDLLAGSRFHCGVRNPGVPRRLDAGMNVAAMILMKYSFMKYQTPVLKGNFDAHLPQEPSEVRKSLDSTNAAPAGSLLRGLRRALLLLILSGVASISCSGCIWWHHHDHDHDHDHGRDHWDHHDEDRP